MPNLTSAINVNVPSDVKEEATNLFNSLGLNMSTAINMFLTKCVKTSSIPFKIEEPKPSKELQKALKEEFMTGVVSSIKNTKHGIAIEQCNKVEALHLLGQHLGMFKNNQPVIVNNNVPNPYKGLTKEELSRLFDKIVVFDSQEITPEIKEEYNLTDEMYKELYENGGLAFHLKFMYPQTITNRWM